MPRLGTQCGLRGTLVTMVDASVHAGAWKENERMEPQVQPGADKHSMKGRCHKKYEAPGIGALTVHASQARMTCGPPPQGTLTWASTTGTAAAAACSSHATVMCP